MNLDDITVVIVNFKTKHLVEQCYTSLRAHYPDVQVIVIDNGSQDASTEYIERLKSEPRTTCLLLNENLGHGPALHFGMEFATTRYVFALDSDCIVREGGFLEAMLGKMNGYYAIGWLRYVDKHSGIAHEWHVPPPTLEQFCKYIHPAYSMYDREVYFTLPPFRHHGAPAITNMRTAGEQGHTVEAFPISDYIEHLCAGTRRMYEGRWDPRQTEQPKQWDPEATYPI